MVKNMGIPERFKTERLRLGMTQAGLAEKFDVTRRSVNNWESGVGSPNGETLAAFAASGADVQYILTGIPSCAALTADEQQFLVCYRSSTQALKDAALRLLLFLLNEDGGAG